MCFFKPLDDRLKAILQNRGRIRQKCRKVIKNSKLKEKCCRERDRERERGGREEIEVEWERKGF
jgi:hypothetical protein